PIEPPEAPAYNNGTRTGPVRQAGASRVASPPDAAMRTLQAVAALFPQTRDTGLTDAQVADSRARFGANRLTPLPREPVWKKFLEKFDEPIIKILLAASLLKIVVDLFEIPGTTGAVAGAVWLAGDVRVLVAAAVVRGLAEWVPSVLFGLAAVLVVVSVALGHPSFEGLAVMVA